MPRQNKTTKHPLVQTPCLPVSLFVILSLTDPMAFNPHHHYHHQNNHHHTTTTSCCCQTPPYHHSPQPQPSLTTADPVVIATIVSQLLQTQTPPQIPHFLYSQPNNNPILNPNQKYPHEKNDQFSQFHHQQQPHSVFFSLLQRIDALEASLNRFSSSSSSCISLRDVAARTIQTHFRAFLVSRSITLRQLKNLASIKSCVGSLKLSLSRHGFVDFDSLSNKAMDLLVQLDSIQSGDKMIRDSKRSITKEIVQFMETVDGVCVKRHQVLIKSMKNMRIVRNDRRSVHEDRCLEGGVGSKSRNTGSNERKLMANLRERVERIGRMSRALEDGDEDEDAEIEGFEHEGEDGDIIGRMTNNYRSLNGVPTKKNVLSSNAKKRVGFVEDGNLISVYDLDGGARSTSRHVDEIEDPTKGRRYEEEPHSDGEQSSEQSTEDGKNRLSDEVSESHYSQDGDFTFAAPEPVKMEARAGLVTRKPGVKIVG